jgi:hypothetical protein
VESGRCGVDGHRVVGPDRPGEGLFEMPHPRTGGQPARTKDGQYLGLFFGPNLGTKERNGQ